MRFGQRRRQRAASASASMSSIRSSGCQRPTLASPVTCRPTPTAARGGTRTISSVFPDNQLIRNL